MNSQRKNIIQLGILGGVSLVAFLLWDNFLAKHMINVVAVLPAQPMIIPASGNYTTLPETPRDSNKMMQDVQPQVSTGVTTRHQEIKTTTPSVTSILEQINEQGSSSSAPVVLETIANPVPSQEQNLENIRRVNEQRQRVNLAMEERKKRISQVHQAIMESNVLNTYTQPTVVEAPILEVPPEIAEKIKSHKATVH